MGCTQSKIENEETVSRCKERKKFMQEAVFARNAFAAAHSAYAMALKNTGAALSDYAQGEFRFSSHSSASASSSSAAAASSSSAPAAVSSSLASSSAAAAIPQPISDTFAPPPPPPPPPPLQRAATMPEMKASSDGPLGGGLNGTIIEENGTLDEEEDSELENRDRLVRKSRSRGGSNRGRKVNDNQEAPPPPPLSAAAEVRTMPPPQQQHQQQQQQQPYFDYFFSAAENMPGTTLEETPVPEVPPAMPQPQPPISEKEDPIVERKSIDEKLRRVEELSVVGNAKAKMEVEKAAIGVASGRGMKKGKGTASVGERRAGRASVPVNLVHLFTELDDNFLRASESAHDVSKMLEATRLHYHSNFADNRGNFAFSISII